MTKSAPAALAAVFLASWLGAAPAAMLSGSVRIEGRIEKVKAKKKRFNPYASVYQDSKPPAELADQLLVYLDGLKPGAVAKVPAVLGQKDRNFSTSIVPVLPGGQVEIRNDDTIRHHVRSNAKPWNFNLKPTAPGQTVTRSFEAPQDGGLGVVPVYCDIHSDMRSHVLVVPSEKYQLLPEKGGAFTLAGLPAGTYTLTAWHPTLKPVPQQVTLKSGEKKSVVLVMQGKKD